MIRVIHLTDHHFPYHDPIALRRSTEFTEAYKPHIVVIGGDLLDCHTISKFRVRATRLHPLQLEFDTARRYLERLRDVLPARTTVYYTLGNHEDRLEKYLDTKAPGLASLRNLTIQGQLACKDLGVQVYPYGEGPFIGAMQFTHGTMVRKWGGSSVRSLMEREGHSMAIGHSHRLAGIHIRRGSKVILGVESGCLCRPKQGYMKHTPDAQCGFSVFDFEGTASHPVGEPLWTPVPLHSTAAYKLACKAIL